MYEGGLLVPAQGLWTWGFVGQHNTGLGRRANAVVWGSGGRPVDVTLGPCNELRAKLEWWSGGVVEWWSGGVVEWWSGGVVEWWSGGVVEWWSRGVVEWWSGGVVEWWSGGVEEWWSGGVVE